MKRKKKIIVLLAAMALCLGLFAGCSSKSDDEVDDTADNVTTQDSETVDTADTEENTEDTAEDDGTAEAADVVAEVLALTDGGLELQLYDPISAETVIEDYAAVDFSLYEAADGDIYEYTFDDSAIIYLVEDGILNESSMDEISEGDMLVFYLTEEEQTAIVIYHPVFEDTVETTDTNDMTE